MRIPWLTDWLRKHDPDRNHDGTREALAAEDEQAEEPESQ
jgi:hypothetical protein